MDATGPPDAAGQYLLDDEDGWPARRITARVDEAFLRLRIRLGRPDPGPLTLGFDVLPALTGPPAPGSTNRAADAAFRLDPVARTGQAYLRAQLDPLPLDGPVPASARGPAAPGWRQFELLVNRARTVPSTGEKLPAELQNAGALRYGSLWERDGDDLVVRVPWAMLGFADPSRHMVGVPAGRELRTHAAPGVGVTVSASGTDQPAGQVTWVNWNRPYYTERLKQGAEQFRDAALETGGS